MNFIKLNIFYKNTLKTINLLKMNKINKPTREQAQEAVRTLIAWAGDNPDREGLIETPKRVVNAYQDFFAGYQEDPMKILGKTFDEIEGYNDIVLIKNIRLESH